MKGCWQGCFSNGKKNEKLLIRVFQQQKGKSETIAGRSCFVDVRKWWTVVFWEWEEKEVLNSGVSTSGKKGTVLNNGVSVMKKKGRIADSGVSATEKSQRCGTVVVQHQKRVKSAEWWCFNIVKVNSVEQWCFSIVEVNSAEQWCFSIVEACLFEVGSSSSSSCASIRNLQKSTVAWYFLTGIISKQNLI
jgi:hypothetical protein